MAKGFFSKDELSEIKVTRAIVTKKERPFTGTCKDCKLYQQCNSPKMSCKGEGKKGILLVLEYPTEEEDRQGEFFCGQSGKVIKNIFNELDIDVEEDCWYTYAVRCRPSNPDKIKPVTIAACRKFALETLDTLKPKVVITFGKAAMDVLVGARMTGRLSNVTNQDWVGSQIPDQELKVRIFPTWNPKFVFYQGRDDRIDVVLRKQIESHVKMAVQTAELNTPFYEATYNGECIAVYDSIEAIKIIEQMQDAEAVAFDYETTGIKPYRDGQEIYTVSVSDGAFSYAFPYFNDKDFRKAWLDLMRSDTPKIAHNKKFEMLWTKVRGGYNNTEGCWPKNIFWDTMLAAHQMHNLKKTNLKFKTYTLLGIAGYDNAIDHYLQATKDDEDKWGTNAFNRIKEAPLDEVLKYNAMDSLFTYKLYEYQYRRINPHLKKGLELEMTGAEVLVQTEYNGLICDVNELARSKGIMTKKMDFLENEIRTSKEIKNFSLNKTFSLTNPHHLSHLVFNDLGFKTDKKTATGKNKADKEVFTSYNIGVVNDILEWKRWSKARDTYVASFQREITNGVIHPSFSLHIVPSYRSCVAKGSLILAPMNFIEYPEGTPIEQIKAGDFVYCFDKQLKLAIRKVIWAGKTGHRKVVRVYFNKAKGEKGYLDVTPEHKIRLINGEYVRADELLDEDRRDRSNPKWKKQPKVRVLSCARVGDRLFATNQFEELEHRKVYSYFSKEVLTNIDVIHHKNKNHLDHTFSNLQKEDIHTHSALHYCDTIGTKEAKRNSHIAHMKAIKEGRIVFKRGRENPTSLQLTKEECLQLLFDAKGKITRVPYSIDAFKSICKDRDVNIKEVAFFFNEFELFLSKELVFNSIKKYGFSGATYDLRINYYKLQELCSIYGIEYERGFANQNGYKREPVVTINNHKITRIECLEEEVDVYDIEVEDEHNFIANEICVHNSSQNPNFQNIPKRDPKVATLLRRTLKCRHGHKFAEYDYAAMEVRVLASINKDPTLIKYIEDGFDMHREMGAKIFVREPKDVSKKERYNAKNGFVFPTFYGSYYKKTAQEIWNTMEPESKVWVKGKGLRTLDDFIEHMRVIEDEFWYDRFPVAREYKEKIIADYESKGFVELPTGFRCYGPMSHNEILNYPVQGSAFHCLLWTFTQMNKSINKMNLDTKLIGQIHDSTVADINPEEEELFDHLIWKFGTQKIREHWDWIVVPLSLEKSISPINGDWNSVEEIGLLTGE